MSIKPVDFQIMVPRTTEAAKISSSETQRYISAQQHQAMTAQNNVDNSTRLVYSQSKAQSVRIDQRQKKGDGYKGKNKKKGNSSNESESNEQELKISTIDIKI